jgi:hypothetical protein
MDMNRKSVALLIVLVIAGLAPASAIIGYCARMPCCHHAAPQPQKMSADAGHCCTTAACYDAPSVKLTGNASFMTFTAERTLAPPVVVECERQLVPLLTASPPPTTQQRLAILSILII